MAKTTAKPGKKNEVQTKTDELRRKCADIFEGVAPEKMTVLQPLIDNFCFSVAALCDLRAQIEVTGFVEYYVDAKGQDRQKRSAASDSYMALLKMLSTLTRQLVEQVPEASRADELDAFLAGV